MAKTKADWLKEAKELGIKVDATSKIAEIKELIDAQNDSKKAEVKSEKEEKPTVAKAGKRSSKAIKEAEQKQAKEDRKESEKEDEPKAKSKKSVKPARSKLERRSKKYRESSKSIDKNQSYSLNQALELAVKTSTVKFDASVELHVRLNVDPKQADQNIRGSVVLPAGTGKTIRVAVVVDDEEAKKAKASGASIAGTEEIFALLDKEKIDFDVLISTPELMAKLSKYARLLGPKGLMPNPKSGTVTKNIDKAIKESLAGKVEYRVDSSGIIHLSIGKVSFGADKLSQNANVIVSSIKSKKPSTIKGSYIKSAYATSTMGPSIRINSLDSI